MDTYFEIIQECIQNTRPNYIGVVLMDSKGTLARTLCNEVEVEGTQFTDGTTNDYCERLLKETNFTVVDSFFTRKIIHFWTWYSNDVRFVMVIDHMLVLNS